MPSVVKKSLTAENTEEHGEKEENIFVPLRALCGEKKSLTTENTQKHGVHKENESKNTQYSFVFSVVIYVTVAT